MEKGKLVEGYKGTGDVICSSENYSKDEVSIEVVNLTKQKTLCQKTGPKLPCESCINKTCNEVLGVGI